MPYIPIDQIDKHTANRYEAVIVASQRSRQINSERLAKLELMLEDSAVDVDGTKVTTLALQDVLSGKVAFNRPADGELG